MIKERDSFTIPALGKENQDKWFRLIKVKLMGKDAYYPIEKTLKEFI
jgi:hypothetical protein